MTALTALTARDIEVIKRLAQALLAAGTTQSASPVRKRDAGQPLLTLEETAKRLRVSRSTVDRAVRAGELPVIKFRGTFRLPAAFVERLIADAEAGSQVVVEDYARDWIAAVSTAAGAVA